MTSVSASLGFPSNEVEVAKDFKASGDNEAGDTTRRHISASFAIRRNCADGCEIVDEQGITWAWLRSSDIAQIVVAAMNATARTNYDKL